MISGSSTPAGADGALQELRRELAEAQGDDPLAPVTVVAPSGYAAVFVRRWLGSGGGRGWANVTCTTVPSLVRALADPGLAARGLRLASAAVDLEVIRSEANRSGGWLGPFSAHPGGLRALQGALVELRRCPDAGREAVRAGGGRGRDLVSLVEVVGRRLRAGGFTDTADLAAEAVRAAGRPVEALGPVVTWRLDAVTPAERQILRLLGARHPGPCADPDRATFTAVGPCADPDEEARSAVRSLLEAAEAGVPLWQQAVFHPPGPTYARILHQQLAASEVPAHGPDRHRLDRSVTGRSLLGLLDLAGGDWPRHQVVGWLGAAPVTMGPGGPPVPARRWDVVSAAAGVIGGTTQWHERLGRLARRSGPEADDAAALARFTDELFDRATPRGRSWQALATWATGLLDHYLRPDTGPDGWPGAERAAAAQVRRLLETLGDLDHVSPGADLEGFRQAVGTELERTALEVDEASDGGSGDGIFVAPYATARGLRFHTVVVTGLADACVAGGGGDGGRDGGLLGDETRRLDTSGALPRRRDRQKAARRDLEWAVAAGAAARIGTWPRTDPRTGGAQVAWRALGDLVDAETKEGGVASFAAGLAAAGPALSARHLELRRLAILVGGGGDPARALVSGDDRLARGYEALRARSSSAFTRFDGYVGAGTVTAFDPGTPVSATRFETYARCPRRYLFDRVLRVSPRLRPEELWRIEPITRGSLVHAILEAYVAERVHGAPRSLERLLALAEEGLDEAEAGGLVGKPLLWRLDRSAIVRDLVRFHDEESVIEPVAAELSFGAGADDDGPAVAVVLDDGRSVAFQGSVDRVDRTPTGQLMVSDYKTGRQGHLSDLMKDPVARGKLLQLPLYAMAATHRFGGPGPVHARYWLLSGERSAPCFQLVITDDIEARFRHVVALIAGGVEEGCFPAVPGPPSKRRFTHCAGCAFDDVCPPSRDRQWGRKYNGPRLRGVVALVNGDVPDAVAGSVSKRFADPAGGPG